MGKLCNISEEHKGNGGVLPLNNRKIEGLTPSLVSFRSSTRHPPFLELRDADQHGDLDNDNQTPEYSRG